jgi:hypothetical protein
MRIRRFLVLSAVLIAVLPASARAQDKHKAGITMGFPASVGVLWHVNEKVALRPELTFGGSSSETSITTGTQTITINSDGWSIGTGVSALFYLKTEDRLRTYVSPRFIYSHTSASSDTSGLTTVPGQTPLDATQTGDAWGGIGSFGAQYAVGDRFTVFGELGFGFTHSSTSRTATGTSGSGNAWGTRGGVGIVYYP